MDRQIYGSEKPLVLTDLISSLRYELLEISEPREKIIEIKKHLNNEMMDYYTLQSIIDILASISQDKKYREISILKNKLFQYP